MGSLAIMMFFILRFYASWRRFEVLDICQRWTNGDVVFVDCPEDKSQLYNGMACKDLVVSKDKISKPLVLLTECKSNIIVVDSIGIQVVLLRIVNKDKVASPEGHVIPRVWW